MKDQIQANVKVYAFQVSGISCINCANNIKSILAQGISDTSLKVNVNVMQQKVYLTTNQSETPEKAIEILKQTKYVPVNEPIVLSGNQKNHRNIVFLVDSKVKEGALQLIKKAVGIINFKIADRVEKSKIIIQYNSQIIKGRQLGDLMQSIDKDYLVVNQKIESLSQNKKIQAKETSILPTIYLWLYFLVIHMIFPVLPLTKQFYQQCSTFPKEFGIYSFSVLLNLSITIYVMNKYAKGFIIRSYNNYKALNTTNMETLIALGSVSAFGLSAFFLVRYTFLGAEHLHMAIMDINDALTSASVIVLTVTIGKHFERRAKQKIQMIASQIFPQSVLFQNTIVKYTQMRNRQLTIIKQKDYDVSLIEKGDVLKIVEKSRILVDLIIAQGSLRVVQSARTGNDNIVSLTKGDRLESGAVVHEVEGICLAEVENVIEDSLLLKLATHVKFAQNSEENSQSGIQAICQHISNVFVRGVIILSIITVIAWTVLLSFQIVQFNGCNICWIFERGISVLVASCPCALGLAVPSVIAIILQLAIKSGILIRSNRVFENMKKVKKIAFDKTGTLFTRLQKIKNHKILSKEYKEQQLWEMVAILQKQLRHPLAEVLYRQALARCKINGTNFNFLLLGKPVQQKSGITATVIQKKTNKNIRIIIGNEKMLKAHNISQITAGQHHLGSTEIFLVAENTPSMSIQLDTHSDLRPQAIKVVEKIQQEGIEVHILSGDSLASVEKLGHQLKIESGNLHAEYSSDDKYKWIKANQSHEKQSVIMVGDGLNDIPCLQEAQIGISINAKSELNINAADVIILSENLYKILALIRFLKKANKFITINLFWAFIYNLITMPIVAGVFYNWGIYISPIWSCVAMSCSSLIVVSFSHLLVCFHYDDSLLEPGSNEFGIKYQTSHLADSTRQVFAHNLSLHDQIS